MSPDDNLLNDNTTKESEKGWAAFTVFKKDRPAFTPTHVTAKKDFSWFTKLLIFLIPTLLFAMFYHYAVVQGSSFFGLTLRHNIDLESGLVGHWTFDGQDTISTTATDISGNGNNGTLSNGPAKVIGKVGQGLSFDGVDDYITAPDAGSLDLPVPTHYRYG